jgi:hypothetical protein
MNIEKIKDAGLSALFWLGAAYFAICLYGTMSKQGVYLWDTGHGIECVEVRRAGSAVLSCLRSDEK